MYTLDEFIDRLQSLRVTCGGDAPVTIEVQDLVDGGFGPVEYEQAMAELQNVSPECFRRNGEVRFCVCDEAEENQLTVISIS